ncbi:dCMP deaminase family protein [Candidatus Uhrbacteria bacterium]|jgi:dCMP deaminase|nr:dCMP deaminase family protein [Candidatus Uhrbacteria bacterium]
MKYPTKQAFRPAWDDYFMSMAYMAAERSTCDRLRSGAILVKDKRVIGSGYNGSPPKMEHCDDVGHLMHEGHCIRTLHAEENTLLQAARLGTSTNGSTIYSIYSPCYHCLKKLIAGGVKRIVAAHVYRDTRVSDACVEAGVMYDRYTPNGEWLDYLVELYKILPREKTSEVKSSDTGEKNYESE